MATKKKVVKKKKGEGVIKAKGLFDHLNQIYQVQDPNYFNTLSERDLKSWSSYMINRFISMNPDFIDVINDVQQFMELPKHLYYKVLIELIPKGRYFFPYIKSKKESYNKGLVNLLCKHYEISSNDATDYIDLYLCMGESGMKKLVGLCKTYGKDEKEIKELFESSGE